MLTNHLSTLGLGSSFNQVAAKTLVPFDINKYIPEYQLFYTGRHAIRYLIDGIKKTKAITTIWIPAYYCQHVSAWLREVYNDSIKTYQIYPFDATIEFSLDNFTNENDIVLLNNFWGVYSYIFPTQKNRAIFIEDHSHGWLSNNALNSKADYCFASLRKTLPIPLGGIAWSTKNELPDFEQNTKEQSDFMTAWETILKAMRIKTALLRGSIDYKKQDYLALVNKYEAFLHHQHNVIAVHENHKHEIETFLNKDYRHYKQENLNFLTAKLENTSLFKVVDSKNDFTFGLELVFKNRETLNEIKTYLVAHNIYPSELWPDNHSTTDVKYLLNIHIDFRYQKTDIAYIATTLNHWIKKNNKT